ncbi:MAG: phosphatase PAP2 family protein [Microbacterium sp.]
MESTDGPRVAGLNRITLFVVGAVLLAVAFALGAVIYSQSGLFAVDTWWNGILVDLASPLLTVFARAMDFVGGGWFGVILVPVVCVIALLLLKRPWSALFFVAVSIASAGVVQVLKQVFGRARPDEILVVADVGSFPSGHAANAATLAALAFLLFPRLWVAIVAGIWMVLMALSRTAVHAHWLSDTVGGVLVGIGVTLIVAGLFAPLLARENRPARTESTAH